MTESLPVRIQALILRATPGRGRGWILHCFSDHLGRIVFSAIPPQRGGSFSPFCLIEATVTNQSNDFAVGNDIEVVDSFSALRTHPQAPKGALFLRAIIERCLPMRAPSSELWRLLLSLMELLPSFQDWKAAPLLLAMTLFEHEGVSPLSLAEAVLLTSEGKEAAQKLLKGDESAWRESAIPDDLFVAAMETIGIQTQDG